jgi:hypothetical protein
MKPLLASAVFLAGLLLPSFVDAQMRPAQHSVSFAPVRMGGSFASNRPMPNPVRIGPIRLGPVLGPSRINPTRTAPFVGHRPGLRGPASVSHIAPLYFPGTPCFTNPSYSGSFYCSQFLQRHRRPFYGQSLFVPYYYGSYPVDYESSEQAPAEAPVADNALIAQVENLSEEVEMLREEQSPLGSSRPPADAAQPARVEKVISTVFAYRDGHQFEAQNYAIHGQTLWIFGDQTTKKIPLADLDLSTTKKLNDERGIDFVSP